ncbi:dCTP deaminase [Azospirillaceae bacterium]
MKLSDVDITRYMLEGRLVITPPPSDQQIGAMSVDLQLGTSFRVFAPGKAAFIDLAPPGGVAFGGFGGSPFDDLMNEIQASETAPFFLHPGEFALGVTAQSVTLPSDLAGRLDGRSSLARLGLMVHATAHTIDPGWSGQIVLEFSNCGRFPLALRPGMRICAISFETLMSPTSKPYALRSGSKYKNQHSPLPSRIDQEKLDKN